MHLLCAGTHAGGEDAEVGEFLLAPGGEVIETVVLGLELVEQVLAADLEAVDQSLDAVRELDRAGGAIGREEHGRLGERIVEIRLELRGRIGDLVLLLLSPSVRVQRQDDDDRDDQGIDERDGGEGRREPAGVAVEAPLPEDEEGRVPLVWILFDEPGVGVRRFAQRRPREQDRDEDEDVPDLVGDLDCSRGVATFVVDGPGVR